MNRVHIVLCKNEAQYLVLEHYVMVISGFYHAHHLKTMLFLQGGVKLCLVLYILISGTLPV